MVNIAVAGGTGGVGRTIIDALKDNPKHKAIILSRTVSDGVDLGAPVIGVDYDDVDALQAVLEKHEINAIISALALHIIGVGQAQINLIKAADKSEPTKRFVTSTWAVRPELKWFDLLPHGFQHVASYTELDKTQLEWTAFNVGWFLEYYAMPNVETYIPQTTFVVDMANRHASIPGDGKQKMSFTYTKDVAKFVVAALDLPKWERNTYAIGEKYTWEEFVKIAGEARGGEKFTVTYDSVEKLKAGSITELPGQVAAYSYFPKEWTQKLFSAFGIWVTESIFDFPDEKLLNKQFPDIKVTTVQEMLQSAWKGQ
ncbi:NAD(P)-bd-dom domain-containing protein [Fusarium falciforme]|uniref:NAD(P)-bd-dom domain-containing protein n=1 Tax=Fusarium falciforme TaxID=195108 RepID=UPI002300C3EB|nr:NAD(P)-bd-dom domain-containing protein [Fusarium falciforme]WAO90212.1 NAD(P)-bd-dom domain-containing protein [Fusarium falciforme]